MTTNIKEVNEFIQQLLDACRDCRKQLDDKNEEITRLRELLNRAIGYTKDALFFSRTYENKIQWEEIDKLWDLIRDLEKEALAPAPEEPVSKCKCDYTSIIRATHNGYTYDQCSKCGKKFGESFEKEPVPEWRELGPDEVIQEGDEYERNYFWLPVHSSWLDQSAKVRKLKIRTRRPLLKPIEIERVKKQEEMPLEKAPDHLHAWMRLQEEINKEVAGEIRCLRDEIQKLKDVTNI